MRPKLLALVVLVLTALGLVSFGVYVFVCNGFAEFYNGYHFATISEALQDVQTIHIQDGWEGYSSFSPYITHADFVHKNGTWQGSVLLSINNEEKVHGQWQPITYKKRVAATVSAVAMQKVFIVLQGMPLQSGTYKPAVTHTDDYPHVTLIFTTPVDAVTFHSTSNTLDKTPWQVRTEEGSFVTNSDAPNTALLLLRPYLHEDELKELEKIARRRANLSKLAR